MKKRTLPLLALSIFVSLALGYAAGARAAKATAHKLVPASDIKWTPWDPKNPEGAQVATVWGDMKKGPVGFLLKTPAGLEFPRHAHTPDYDAVVVKGEWKHTFEAGSEAPPLAPGSFWRQPGKQFHGDACTAGGECIVLVYEHGKPDFIPEKQAKK